MRAFLISKAGSFADAIICPSWKCSLSGSLEHASIENKIETNRPWMNVSK